MENTQHFLPPSCITKHVITSYFTCTLPKPYTESRICFGFLPPGEPFQLLNILQHLWLTNLRCVVIVQLSLFNRGYLLLKEQVSFLPLPPSPFQTPNVTQNWPTVKAAENGLNWLSLYHRKTKAGTKEEAPGTEKGFH